MFVTISSTEGTQINLLKEVEPLVVLGFLERENDSEWGDPSFARPKTKSNLVRFIYFL